MSSFGVLNRHRVCAWLRSHGFTQENRSTGHIFFKHPSGVKVVLPGHGRNDLARHVAADILRTIVRAGFDRNTVQRELHMECT